MAQARRSLLLIAAGSRARGAGGEGVLNLVIARSEATKQSRAAPSSKRPWIASLRSQ
jgi:hypothetical protein